MKNLLPVAVLVLAACGGGGGDVPGSQQSDGQVNVTIYGDSTTQATCAPASIIGHCPASVAQRLLADVATVRQEGAGGSGAYQLQMGLDGIHTMPFDQVMLASTAQIVVFRFGINDSQLYSTAHFKSIMHSLVTIAEAAGRKVIIQTPTPVWGHPELANVGANALALPEVAQAHPEAVLCDLFSWSFQEGDEHEVDSSGIHRTFVGVTRDGERTAACIRLALGLSGDLR